MWEVPWEKLVLSPKEPTHWEGDTHVRLKNSPGNQVRAYGSGTGHFLDMGSYVLSRRIFLFIFTIVKIIVVSKMLSPFRKAADDTVPISLKDRKRL